MSDISTLPQVVNIDHYSGDTLPINVNISDELIAGRTFFGQVRSSRGAAKIDATFTVILVPGTGAILQLSSAQCRALTTRGDYTGYWDVQLAEADGSDPVQTLAMGELRMHQDVTRVET